MGSIIESQSVSGQIIVRSLSAKNSEWCAGNDIEVQYIQPGRLMQNAYLFEDTMQVQVLAEKWMQDYNYCRPHSSLNGLTPKEFVNLQDKTPKTLILTV